MTETQIRIYKARENTLGSPQQIYATIPLAGWLAVLATFYIFSFFLILFFIFFYGLIFNFFSNLFISFFLFFSYLVPIIFWLFLIFNHLTRILYDIHWSKVIDDDYVPQRCQRLWCFFLYFYYCTISFFENFVLFYNFKWL